MPAEPPMERRCEPELMQDPLQAQAYADADFAASDADFVAGVLSRAPVGQRPLRLLDLGCGPGNISFRLARACPAASVLGLDGAAAMLAIAATRLQAEPALAERLRFRQERLPLAAEATAELAAGFDLVVSNSLLHHLHDPQVLWRCLPALAAPGAWLVLRDLRRPASQAEVADLVQRYAADAPAVLRHDYEQSLHAAFRLEEVQQQLQEAGLPQLVVAERQDRYLEVWGPLQASPAAA